MPIDRRDLMLGSFGAGLALSAGAGSARAADTADAAPAQSSFDIVPAGGELDQSATLQIAIQNAASSGTVLMLPAGTYAVGGLDLPSGVAIRGVPGRTVLKLSNADFIVKADGADGVSLEGLILDGGDQPLPEDAALLQANQTRHLEIANCRIFNSSENGVALQGCAGRVTYCEIGKIAKTALFSNDATGLEIAHNTIRDCGDNGIQVWRSEPGDDGTLVHANRIQRIEAKSGGSGQYGNGINVFRAGAVVVSNNRIADCAYSAVRDNSGRNCQIVGNSCSRLGETAIFVEFSFDGAVIANNVIDTAATGISVTNFNEGGHLATVQGNLIRNLFFRKDKSSGGIGIAAEADCAISGNVIERAPGYGLFLGWYKYLRDISATGNLIRNCHIGIGVSADGEAGFALITDNMISGAKDGAIRAMNGPKPVGPDLAESSAEAFRNLAVYSNVGI
ncbi:Pectate lyase superfamily protein [Methyloligella halotolerans]|uniref:Pectate lyase superfamily protein n=1 Tax=Methyloligella halotolerans TaxID=1177755 RepID=A0A1E2RXM5_9HYPH|nr:TIGR03808 family TAT-translocated repetitive protein [Methyloligella halotolerans]ODA66890.1 Pectate lyase superfamily protein [Methyloligella halotolerans]